MKSALKAGIRRILDDEGGPIITKFTIGVYGEGDWGKIKEYLMEWESQGYLKILRPIDTAQDTDGIIEMLEYIDKERPWPDWMPKKNPQ